jgi:hypothetical protein
MTVLVSAILHFFFLEVLFNWLALVSYILCLKPIMETLFLHYFKLLQSQMSAVATGHTPLHSPKHYIQVVSQSCVQPLVFYFKRHCVLSWKYVLIHKDMSLSGKG